jgi:hypothetical protein
MLPARLFRRLPAYALNGIEVALGIAAIQLMFTALAGPLAGQLATSGAVCTSLADVPNTARRTWQSVLAAALLSVGASLVVVLMRPYPLALGIGVATIAFTATMALSWGLRAGAVSFAPILSLVFAMALPPDANIGLLQVLWGALGALAYIGWSTAAASLLQPRYRRLALVAGLRATANLFRSRAGLLTAPQSGGDDPMRALNHCSSSASVSLRPSRRTTKATGVSPHCSDATPTTATSATAGCSRSTASRSLG